jgi:hypothetical protein
MVAKEKKKKRGGFRFSPQAIPRGGGLVHPFSAKPPAYWRDVYFSSSLCGGGEYFTG